MSNYRNFTTNIKCPHCKYTLMVYYSYDEDSTEPEIVSTTCENCGGRITEGLLERQSRMNRPVKRKGK